MPRALLPTAILLAAGFLDVFSPARADSPAKADLAESYIAGFFQATVETAVAPRSDETATKAVKALLQREIPLDETARFMLGRAWPAESEDAGRRFQDSFRDFVAEAVTLGLRANPALALEVKGSRQRSDGSALVLSTLILPSGTTLPVDWKVAPAPSGRTLQIVDITVAGFNAAFMLRSMAEATLAKTDIDGLIPSWRAALTRRIGDGESPPAQTPP